MYVYNLCIYLRAYWGDNPEIQAGNCRRQSPRAFLHVPPMKKKTDGIGFYGGSIALLIDAKHKMRIQIFSGNFGYF